MRALRVVHTVSSLLGGGMEHFILRLAAAQQARGHEVAVVSMRGGPLVEQAERAGVRAYVTEGGKLERVIRATAFMARLRPNIVHAHNPTSLHYAVLGKSVSGAKLVLTDHAQTRGVVRVPNPIEWRFVDAIVAVSKETAEKSHTFGARGHIQVIHNGVSPKPPKRSRAEVREDLGVAEDRAVIVHVAGYFHVKAHDVVIDAMAKLAAKGVAATALLVGEGERFEEMKARAKAANVGEDVVRFLGFRADVPDLLGASDIFTLPSRNEGLPLSVLEAMAQGVPVVATPVGGVPELVDDGVDGLLVPVDDVGALAAALERLAGDPGLRRSLGAAGQQKVAKSFTFEHMTDRYEALYRSLVP